MSTNPLNDISRVYLEQVASVDEGYKPIDREKESAMYRRAGNLARTSLSSRGKKKEEAQTKSANIVRAITRQKERERFDRIGQSPQHNEALDPVGREDADINNDGKTDKSDKYLHNRRKAVGKAIAKKTKKKGMKEGFSNWRQDLSEVMTDIEDKKKIIKEKPVENKITINPKLSEAVEEIGGVLLEMVQFDSILDEIADDELDFISDTLIESAVQEIFYECLEEGYELDEIETMLCESIDTSLALLTEAEVTYGHDTENPAAKKRGEVLSKVKSAVKTVGKGLARGAGYVAGAAVRGAKALGREVAAGYQRGRDGSSTSGTTSSTSSSQGGAGSTEGGDEDEKKPGIISKIGSKLKSGLKKAVASGARAVSRGARNLARRMEGGQTSNSPAKKGQSSEPETSEPEETGRPAKKRKGGPSYAEVKAEIEKREAEKKEKKAKKDDKIDDLLSSIRNEETQLDERTLSKKEMSKREEIVKSMKKNKKGFEERYPGRGKEVMYATATKMAKKIAEQNIDWESYEPEGEQLDEFLGIGRVVAGRSQRGVDPGTRFTQAGTVQKIGPFTVPGSFKQGASQSAVNRHNKKASPNTQIKPDNEKRDQNFNLKPGSQSTVGITPDKKPAPTATAKPTPKSSSSDRPSDRFVSAATDRARQGRLMGSGMIANTAKGMVSRNDKLKQAQELMLRQSYEPEGGQLDERRRAEKGTPRKPRDKAFELVANSMGSGRLGVQPRGEKKDRGGPTPGPSMTPAQKVAKRRADAQRAQDLMHSPRD